MCSFKSHHFFIPTQLQFLKIKRENRPSEMFFQPILKSMTQEEVLKQVELHFLKHFQVSQRFGEWICYPATQTKRIYHKLRLILSWLNGVRVHDKRMEDRHVLSYTISLMKQYRPFTYSMMSTGCLPYYSLSYGRFRFPRFK